MMTEVATVSIVAKNKYSGKAGGLPHPAGGGSKVRKPFYKGYNATRDYIRQPVHSKGKQPTCQNHGDGYFHQDR